MNDVFLLRYIIYNIHWQLANVVYFFLHRWHRLGLSVKGKQVTVIYDCETEKPIAFNRTIPQPLGKDQLQYQVNHKAVASPLVKSQNHPKATR